MVRQAKSYLAGAVGSAGLIAACVAVFVGLVALGASGKLPVLSSLGDDEPAAQEKARSTEPAAGAAGTSAAGAGASVSPDTAPAAGRDTGEGGDSTRPLTGTAGGGSGDPPTTSSPQSGPDTPRAATTGASSPNRSSTRSPAPKAPQTPTQPAAGLPGSQDIVDSVDGTVDEVDEALGGPLEESGVGGAVKDAAGSAAGPDSTVGEAADGLTGALGG